MPYSVAQLGSNSSTEDSVESRTVFLFPLRRSNLRGRSMKPHERGETGEQDLFCARLYQIVDMNHPLVKLGQAIDRGF